ncbi:MAG: hypothetical protein HKP37_06460 [Boseongicola sp.]|nr:hypothetical protein [Boseongicola sp.]NNL18366.1 hypothetical protein [Boseongicola sp.]
MSSLTDLRNSLEEYDGKSPTILSEIATLQRGRKTFLPDLVTLASDPQGSIADGATWILGSELKAGETLAVQEVHRLLSSLTDIVTWQAQLHICQSLRHLSVPPELLPDLISWLTPLLEAKRPFLRTWSMDALCSLWGTSPDTDALLTRMETDDAASVLARARALRREFAPG